MWRRAIIAWFVAAALVAVGAALRGGEPTSAGSSAPGSAGQPVVAEGRLPVDRVDGVTVTRGGHTLQFRREGDGWWQVAPWRQPAEAAALRDVLLRLADLRATRRVDGGGAELGLDPPEAELEVTWPEGKVAVALGRRSVGGRAWARGPDGAAWSVDPALHDAILDADLREWRSWRLFEGAGVGPFKVSAITVPNVTLVDVVTAFPQRSSIEAASQFWLPFSELLKSSRCGTNCSAPYFSAAFAGLDVWARTAAKSC